MYVAISSPTTRWRGHWWERLHRPNLMQKLAITLVGGTVGGYISLRWRAPFTRCRHWGESYMRQVNNSASGVVLSLRVLCAAFFFGSIGRWRPVITLIKIIRCCCFQDCRRRHWLPFFGVVMWRCGYYFGCWCSLCFCFFLSAVFTRW